LGLTVTGREPGVPVSASVMVSDQGIAGAGVGPELFGEVDVSYRRVGYYIGAI
jgi:hypothetical protein